MRGLACLQASARTNCLRPRERSSFCAPRRTHQRDSKAYQCRRWPRTGSRGKTPWLFLLPHSLVSRQENEVAYSETEQSLKVKIKPNGRATNNMIYFPAQAAGAHPFPSSEKDAKGAVMNGTAAAVFKFATPQRVRRTLPELSRSRGFKQAGRFAFCPPGQKVPSRARIE